MFKINLFYPIEYRLRIRNYITLKMKVNVILNQWHLKTINEQLVIYYEYVSQIDSLSVILQDLDFLPSCPFASTVGHWRGRGYMCIN